MVARTSDVPNHGQEFRREPYGEHTPVLASEFIDALCTDPDGYYVDATFGRGGHSRMLLHRLSSSGQLIALDRDPDAVAEGRRLETEDPRFRIFHCDFASLEMAIHDAGWDKVTGIGFDLGVSSPQFDQADRGFSFQHDGPLDMRMNFEDGQPLSRKLKDVSEKELVRVLREYGDERYAGRIATAILRALKDGELNSTRELENICFHAVPKQARYSGAHPATRTFQALRIWVNDEYGQIESGIRSAMQQLLPGGRLAVISFHSGEDRRIRDLIEAEVHPCTCPPQFPVCVCGRVASMRWVQKKPLRPSEEEIAANPRSRSSMLRIAEAVQVSKSQ
ncbi:MAG: 16S rRNA (cytosine(1402)-N(4))-methyltransferase RsmH [Mariprofundaceae bacterium]|nr:16S rRNA (cytosine(1402)-N(4))-methyltransferase RsmH [Mariprofundaceae bacterium]